LNVHGQLRIPDATLPADVAPSIARLLAEAEEGL
jgi:hypothetical protein